MTVEKAIKVLIVEDSQVVRTCIAGLLSLDPRMEVIGMARNGREALRFLSHGRPDVVLMDVEMPEMDGLEATRRIMETHPVPIIICSASVSRRDAKTTLRLLESGAVACVETPRASALGDPDALAAHLLQTVRLMSEVKVVRRWPRARGVAQDAPIAPPALFVPAASDIHFIGIGASTGGPEALKTILAGLPAGFPVPLLVVQHIARGFVNGLADWLNRASGIDIRVAAHGVSPRAGQAYLAPDDFHMELSGAGAIVLVRDSMENGVRPSVSHLFLSMARSCGPNAVGVLLTGMGKDGAGALKRMRECGATTIAQDRESSVVHGMPGEAIAIGAAGLVLSAGQIAPALVALANQQNCSRGGLSWSH